MILNLGCGYKKFSGSINIDHDPGVFPDVLLDLEKDKLPFDDNTVDKVFAHHVLDRLGDGYLHCIKEIYRVCKPGAMIEILSTPPRSDRFYCDPTIRRGITPESFRLLSKKYSDTCDRSFERTIRHVSYNLSHFLDVDFELHSWCNWTDDRYDDTFDKSYHDKNVMLYNNIENETEIKLIVVKS